MIDPRIARWEFDEGQGKTAREGVSGEAVPIRSPFREPEWARGVEGSALRLDGYSTWVEWDPATAPQPAGGLTVSAWVAMPAYPVGEAGIVDRSAPGEAGYRFGLDTYGRPFMAVALEGEWHTCRAEASVPKYRWAHLAGTFDRKAGLRVYIDGRRVAEARTPDAEITPADGSPLGVGRDPRAPNFARIFPTGVLNGLIDEVRIEGAARSEGEVREAARRRPPSPDLAVPKGRFSEDPHRPRYHPIPASDWTNEPHGLVFFNGEYHLFFQKNPNGPYWSQIHWGHLRSRDLVTWTEERIALAPEPGYDRAGIWSGGCVIHDGVPTAVYTGVDGAKAGICLATSRDGMKTWRKRPENPVVGARPDGFLDFRDPYVWREGDAWYLVIGSGTPDVGGTALLYHSDDLVEWTYLKPLLQGRTEETGHFWEMPVLVPIGGGKHLFYVTTMEHRKPARGLYWIGTWAGEAFTPDAPEPRQTDLVNRMLSPAMLPTEGGVLAIGIVPEMRRPEEQLKAGWAHTYCLPRLLSLSPEGELVQKPHPALERRRGEHRTREDVPVRPVEANPTGLEGVHVEIRATLEPGTARRVGLRVRRSPDGEEETLIYYDNERQMMCVDRARSSRNPDVDREEGSGAFALAAGEPLELRVFLDGSVAEVFVNGRGAFATRIYPTRRDSVGIGLYAEGGTAMLRRMDVWRMI